MRHDQGWEAAASYTPELTPACKAQRAQAQRVARPVTCKRALCVAAHVFLPRPQILTLMLAL